MLIKGSVPLSTCVGMGSKMHVACPEEITVEIKSTHLYRCNEEELLVDSPNII